MKYIRTKDKIYEVISEDVAEFGDETCKVQGYICKSKTKNSNYKPYIDEYQVVKQANTIEELCDEFVMLRLKDELNDNEPIIFTHLDLAKSYFEKYLGYAIYGAVWCEFGLKYVARINNEGKLELI